MGIETEHGAPFDGLSRQQESLPDSSYPASPASPTETTQEGSVIQTGWMHPQQQLQQQQGRPLTYGDKPSILDFSCTELGNSTTPEPDGTYIRGNDMAQQREDPSIRQTKVEAIEDLKEIQIIHQYLQDADTARLNLNHFPVRADRMAEDLHVSPQEVMRYAECLVTRGRAERIDISNEPFPFYRIREVREREKKGFSVLNR
jgi:hypothetical protein